MTSAFTRANTRISRRVCEPNLLLVNLLTNNIERSLFDLFEDAAYVLGDDADAEQLDAAEDQDRHHQAGPARDAPIGEIAGENIRRVDQAGT